MKSHHVYLSGFQFSESTGTGTKGQGWISLYCAPEVAAGLSEDTDSDVWSLGCVFLEIWTTLCDKSVSDLKSFLQENGSKSPYHCVNLRSTHQWCGTISASDPYDHTVTPDYEKPGLWIIPMLQSKREERPSAQVVLNLIRDATLDPGDSLRFAGECCIKGDYAAEFDSGSKVSDSVPTNQIGRRIIRPKR
jgi:serine/threonine protein kinase